MKRLIRDFLRSGLVQRALGLLAAEYLRLVWLTNRFSLEPPDVYEQVEPQMPCIFVFWHGQHLMTPFIRIRGNHRAKVLISRHRDGEFNAIAAERLGVGTIRGSGTIPAASIAKGASALSGRCCRRWRTSGTSRPPPTCPSARGSPASASSCWPASSGRPIMPFAMVTSRFIRLKNWDSTTINLPFGRGALVGIDSVEVPPDADAETMETLRLRVEALLNEATRKAYAVVGRPEGALG